MAGSKLQQPAVLVVGADSLIGGGLASAWSQRGAVVLGTSRRTVHDGAWLPLDLSTPDALRIPRRIDLAYLCAGVTDMERCERDPEGTARVNVDGNVAVARRLVADGAWVLFPSSNIVFDGSLPWRKAEDPVSPPAEYGRQKARAESAILSLGGATAVLRMGKVVGRATGPFAGWVRSLRLGETVEAFTDKVCAPLSLASTVSLMASMGERRLSGIYQACARRDITYDEAAVLLAHRLGVDPSKVRKVLGRERGVRASFLPAHTTLDPRDLRVSLDWTPPAPESELLAGLEL